MDDRCCGRFNRRFDQRGVRTREKANGLTSYRHQLREFTSMLVTCRHMRSHTPALLIISLLFILCMRLIIGTCKCDSHLKTLPTGIVQLQPATQVGGKTCRYNKNTFANSCSMTPTHLRLPGFLAKAGEPAPCHSGVQQVKLC